MARAKLLVDGGIALDCLQRREPFFEHARKLMICGCVGELSLWLPSTQVPMLVQELSNGGDAELLPTALERLRVMRQFVNILEVGQGSIDAMLATTWPNAEDALLIDLALSMKADALITRNRALRSQAQGLIPIYSCYEYFDLLEREQGIVYEDIPEQSPLSFNYT